MRAALLPLFALITSFWPVQLAAELPSLKVQDVVSWKRIQSPIVSNDGQWFAYKLAQTEGDSELVLAHLPDGKEQRFAIGELERPNPYLSVGTPPPGGPPHLHGLFRRLQVACFRTAAQKRRVKGTSVTDKPIENKVVAVELATGKKTEYDRIKRFTFSGERASALALLRYGAAAPPPAATPAPASGGAKPDDRPRGSDLILVELAAGTELSLGNVSDYAFDKAGNWLAWTVDAPEKLGNGVEIRDMRSGKVTALDSAKATYRGLNWTETGNGLAVLRGTEDKKWDDKVYALLAFRHFGEGGEPEKLTFAPEKDQSFLRAWGLVPSGGPSGWRIYRPSHSAFMT